MVYVGRDRVQISPWKSSESVANLVPFPARDTLPVDAVHRTVYEAITFGYKRAYTAALSPRQAEPFFEAGFELHEKLHLLRHDLGTKIDVDRGTTRRARRADWDDVIALDHLAFEEFWQFDRNALADAIRATPRHRFHVIKTVPVAGYHVTGLAGSNAYVQRVAVHPDSQGQGYGKALVDDALRWASRSGARMAHVNTQIINERAVALYERCGFVIAPEPLLVLHHTFDESQLPGSAGEFTRS